MCKGVCKGLLSGKLAKEGELKELRPRKEQPINERPTITEQSRHCCVLPLLCPGTVVSQPLDRMARENKTATGDIGVRPMAPRLVGLLSCFMSSAF